MKIGICTCYDNHNYGSMLQAYATYVKFVELGYDCEFLCYRKKLNTIQKIKWLPRLLNKYLMKEKFRLIEKKIQLKKHPDIKMKDAIRQRAFDRFLENFLKDKVSAPYIGFEALRAGSKNYDVVVAGGDQLWIPAGLPTNFFNLMFADEKVKRVSYSTSFGVTEVPFYQKRRTIEYLNRIEMLAGHVSEINLCIQIAYLAKNMLDETDNFTEYLTSDKGKWAMQYIDRAETLWDECKQLISDSAYEDLDGIEERLHSLTVSVEDSIDIWKKYIENAGNKNCTQARRILARSYLKVAEQTKDSENKKTLYTKVIQLMEENISEENQHVGNIRIWFDSIKRIEVENQDMLIQDAIIKLNRWVNLTDSVDAHYYRFILKFIQAIEGSTLAEGELPKLLRELKHTAANKYNRTVPQHWLSKNGKGINALITNNRNRRNAVPEDEMSEILLPFIGRISNNYVNDSHAYINRME